MEKKTKNKLFDIGELERSPGGQPADRSAVLADNFLHQHNYRVQSLKQLTGRLPEQGEFFLIWTMKSFNAFTFIPYLIRELGRIDYLVLSTYSINRRIIDSLIKKIVQEKILHVKLFISDSIKYRMPKVVDHLHAVIDKHDNFTVHYAWNHSKITLVEAGERFFCIEGSGNWSENAQHEQYVFFNDKRVYDFRMKCITDGLYRKTNTGN